MTTGTAPERRYVTDAEKLAVATEQARIGAEEGGILEFFHAAGVPVNEGYGLSESTAMGTLNTADALRIGSIGRPVPGCEIRIADDGEILMRGPHIFAGYWQNPEATAETLVDGWLQTGDLGAIDEQVPGTAARAAPAALA